MQQLDAYATERHFIDHMAPVLAALPGPALGRIVVPDNLVAHARAHGIEPSPSLAGDGPILIASYGDLKDVRDSRKRIAYLEHGSGQSWGGGYFGPPRSSKLDHYSHPGGIWREPVSLFLHPNEHAARRERAAYPDARVEVIGCPKLDTLPAREPGPGPVVAISFSGDQRGPLRQGKSAFRHYMKILPMLRRHFTVIGHGHPKMQLRLRHHFDRAHIPFIADFEDVCRQADLYVNDSSSTLYEFAAAPGNRPVVVLNAPHYTTFRLPHGLRFGPAADVGLQVATPAALIRTIVAALADPPEQRAKRAAALDIVYAYRTGAAGRAADVLLDWMGEKAAKPARRRKAAA